MIWMIFSHYLLSKRSSALVRIIAWLCISGVGVGVAAMVIVLSVMNGFDGAIRKRLLTVEPHLVVHFEKDRVLEQEKRLEGFLADPIAKKNQAVAESFETQDVIVRTSDGQHGGAVAQGLSAIAIQDIFAQVNKLKNEENLENSKGTFLKKENSMVELNAGEAALGIELAQSLGAFEGDEITVVAPESLLLPAGEIPTFEKLIVKSVMRTNVPDADALNIYYDRSKTLKKLSNTSGIERGMEIRLNNPENFTELKNLLSAKGFKVDSWEDRNSALFHSLRMEKLAMGLFLALSILIACFSILTVLVLLVTHKRSEIGVLMSMGLSVKKTRHIFAGVGMLLSGIGLIGGTTIGLLICLCLDKFPVIKLPDIYYDTRVPVLIDPLVIGIIVVSSVVVSFLASWVPAYLSTRLSPAEIIRPVNL